ncbi:1-acyl-sn-glycerol-3-phosphate acyltransferase, partial [Staphylococcus pettenkoferi]
MLRRYSGNGKIYYCITVIKVGERMYN